MSGSVTPPTGLFPAEWAHAPSAIPVEDDARLFPIEHRLASFVPSRPWRTAGGEELVRVTCACGQWSGAPLLGRPCEACRDEVRPRPVVASSWPSVSLPWPVLHPWRKSVAAAALGLLRSELDDLLAPGTATRRSAARPAVEPGRAARLRCSSPRSRSRITPRPAGSATTGVRTGGPLARRGGRLRPGAAGPVARRAPRSAAVPDGRRRCSGGLRALARADLVVVPAGTRRAAPPAARARRGRTSRAPVPGHGPARDRRLPRRSGRVARSRYAAGIVRSTWPLRSGSDAAPLPDSSRCRSMTSPIRRPTRVPSSAGHWLRRRSS